MDYHGWSLKGSTSQIYVGLLAHEKKPQLYMMCEDGNRHVIQPLAKFNSEEGAARFMQAMDILVLGMDNGDPEPSP